MIRIAPDPQSVTVTLRFGEWWTIVSACWAMAAVAMTESQREVCRSFVDDAEKIERQCEAYGEFPKTEKTDPIRTAVRAYISS